MWSSYLRPRCQKRSKLKEFLAVFVGSCLVPIVSRRVLFPQKEHTNNHKVAERGCCVVQPQSGSEAVGFFEQEDLCREQDPA